jgi:hypothetical protein
MKKINIVKIRKIILEELEKVRNTTNDANYMFDHSSVPSLLDQLVSIGNNLDRNVSNNLSKLQVLSTGERSGRALAEIGYPDGTVVLFYKSMSGTSGKSQGKWYPIPGFSKFRGWFIKDTRIKQMYGSRVFQGTSDYLSANEDIL